MLTPWKEVSVFENPLKRLHANRRCTIQMEKESVASKWTIKLPIFLKRVGTLEYVQLRSFYTLLQKRILGLNVRGYAKNDQILPEQ